VTLQGPIRVLAFARLTGHIEGEGARSDANSAKFADRQI